LVFEDSNMNFHKVYLKWLRLHTSSLIPLKAKRSFQPEGHKSDPADSCQISEYACRFWDELTIWAPRQETLEQIKTLLTTREQFVAEKTSHMNALKALKRKAVRTKLSEDLHEKTIDELKAYIQQIEEEIQRLIDQDPNFHDTVKLLRTIPGVGFMLAAHMFAAVCSLALLSEKPGCIYWNLSV